MIYQSINELQSNLSGIVELADNEIIVKDEVKLREFGIDHLIYAGVLSDDAQVRHIARVYIRQLARHFNVVPSSIYPLYQARGKGEVNGFTVPAMNMRAMTYDVARVIFEQALATESGTFIFEISRSEMKYTVQDQDELAVAVLAAAIKTGYEGAVFLQGDHYQADSDKYSQNPRAQIDELQVSIKDALSAGFYNIDIDASTLVDLKKESLDQQQKENYETTASLTKFIRSHQPPGITIAIGGEIGHIGGVNSTAEDFEAFMKGYLEILESEGISPEMGISKVSVQTGTSHGGVPNPDGTLAEVKVDFSVLKDIGEVARDKFGMAGAVQHGASTLSNDMFGKFPEAQTAEIHLATGFQNIIFNTMPEYLKNKLYDYVRNNLINEREIGASDEQFIYKLRKKAIGPHKKDLWLISENDKEIMRAKLREEIALLFEKLNIHGTGHTVRQYVG